MSVAWVSGAFSLIVAGLLLFNYVTGLNHPVKEPIYSAKLVEQKSLLGKEPKNEELKKEIRKKDFELRQRYFQRKAFSNRGKYLLFAGLLIFVASIKTAEEVSGEKRPEIQVCHKRPEF